MNDDVHHLGILAERYNIIGLLVAGLSTLIRTAPAASRRKSHEQDIWSMAKALY